MPETLSILPGIEGFLMGSLMERRGRSGLSCMSPESAFSKGPCAFEFTSCPRSSR